MGLYRRKDSPFFWAWIEGGRPFSTGIPVDGGSDEMNRELRRQAQAVYAAAKGDHARQRVGIPVASSSPTFDTFATWYDRHVIATHKGRDRERELLATLRKAFGHLPLHRLTRARVEEWRSARIQAVSTRTAERELDLLKAMLKRAVALGHVPASPLVGLRRLPYVPPRRRLLQPDEERRLLTAARDPVDKALLLLALDSLVRLGDVLDITRADDQGAWIYIRDPKDPRQARAYDVPVSPRTRTALDRIPGDEPYYFARYRAGSDWQRRQRVRDLFRRLCAKADVPYGRKAGGLTFHWATRTTGATRLIVQKHVDPKTVQSIGNWKTADVVMNIYAQKDRDAMLLAVGAQPSRTRRLRGRKNGNKS